MTIETELHAGLLANAALVALVGQGVALSAVPESQPLPYVVYGVVHNPDNNLGGEQLLDEATVTLQCWGEDAIQADAVADLVVESLAAIDMAPPGVNSVWVTERRQAFDPEIGIDSVMLTTTWIKTD